MQRTIISIVETALYADDLERMEEFYRDVLGLEVIGREPDRHVFFRVGVGNVLLVFSPAATLRGDVLPPHGATGPGHIAFGIAADARIEWEERLMAHGVVIEKRMTWPQGGKSLYFRDPAGNSVEFITPGVWNTRSGW